MNRRVKRRITRIVIIILVLLSMVVLLNGQTPIKRIYEDYGTWVVETDNNQIGVAAYTTVERITEFVEDDFNYSNAYAQKKLKKEQKRIVRYKYDLYLASESIYNGDSTGTWMYGIRIFASGVEISKEQYPDGFMEFISIEPTLIYTHETGYPENINFEIKWDKAAYEPRLLK